MIIADVTKDARRIVDETLEAFGKLDVLINNAAVLRAGGINDGKLVEAYDEVMDTNVRAVMNMTMIAAPYLKATKGNVINISGLGGQKIVSSVKFYTGYCVSKAAIDHFTRAAAIELAADGVRVNAVNPGPVRTDILESSNLPVTWDVYEPMTLLGRVSEPEEIGELLLYLASDKAKSITGSNFVIDNGLLLK